MNFMQSKISSKWLVLVLGVVAIVCLSRIIFFLQSSFAPPDSFATRQIQQGVQRASSMLPIRLTIPRLNVDAAIEDVGLTSQGAMDVPKGPADVAWFDLGSRPGEKGSAVIAGHEGWKDGIPAVFDNLHELQKGDELYVRDENGAIIAFVVREVRTYDQNGDSSDVFNSSDGRAHLNLITCGGIWNATQKSYSNRLVVFTDEEIK
jgi:LPXTG-site transpeptidase (sortase) family protein